MAANYSRYIFRELEKANEEINNLKTRKIPNLKKEYEAKIYDIRTAAAEKLSAVRMEKDAEIASLRAKVADLESKLSAAENEAVRLKNMMNKDSTNSSNPPSSDEVWEGKGKRKSANEYNPGNRQRNTKEGRKDTREHVSRKTTYWNCWRNMTVR